LEWPFSFESAFAMLGFRGCHLRSVRGYEKMNLIAVGIPEPVMISFHQCVAIQVLRLLLVESRFTTNLHPRRRRAIKKANVNIDSPTLASLQKVPRPTAFSRLLEREPEKLNDPVLELILRQKAAEKPIELAHLRTELEAHGLVLPRHEYLLTARPVSLFSPSPSSPISDGDTVPQRRTVDETDEPTPGGCCSLL